MTIRLIAEIAAANTLGEGIQWRASDRSIWWTDILECKLYCARYPSLDLRVYDMPEPLGSFAFTEKDGVMLAAFASGFAFYDLSSGAIKWINRPLLTAGEDRFNDGRADRQGRFWAGTMVKDPHPDQAPAGRLFSLGLDHHVTEHEKDIQISNSLCWSPDGSKLYFADSMKGEIWVYDFDQDRGAISNRRKFAAPLRGAPDGAAITADGHLWSATWGSGKVTRYDTHGKIAAEIRVPAQHVSCCAFGGEALNLLLVTTARQGLSAEKLKDQPSAGNVFIFETDAAGLAEDIYRGPVPHI